MSSLENYKRFILVSGVHTRVGNSNTYRYFSFLKVADRRRDILVRGVDGLYVHTLLMLVGYSEFFPWMFLNELRW
jgi:hypothetical protein